MKEKRTAALFSVITLLVSSLLACNLGMTPEDIGETVDVLVRLTLPDYASHLPQTDLVPAATERSPRPKVVDPATDTVIVTVADASGTLATGTFTFYGHDSDSGQGNWEWDSGHGWFNCTVTNVPVGMYRTITAETYDSGGTLLTSGSINTNIDKFREWYGIDLEPVSTTPIWLDTPINSNVAEGSMKYFRFIAPSAGRYMVTVHSEYHDVNLYLFHGAHVNQQSWFQSEPPIDEAIIFHHDWYWEGDKPFFIGIYGGLISPVAIGNTDLTAGGIDLSTNKHITIVTGCEAREVDLSTHAGDPASATLANIQDAIESADICNLEEVSDDGAGHLLLRTSYRSIQVLPGTTTNAFAAVWGEPSSEPNNFVVEVRRFEGRSFDEMVVQEVDPTTQPYASIEGQPGAKQLWVYQKEYPFKEVDLGFTFYYNGTAYSKIYVSPNGYLSFWKYRLYYSWWYWHYPDDYWYNAIDWSEVGYWYDSYWWRNVYLWGWEWLYSGEGKGLPNELVALYRAPFYFSTDPDPEPNDESQILYLKRTTTDGKYQFVVEYKNMYHRYDPQNTTFDRYLSGQIILTEGDSDLPVKDGTIDLRYNHDNSNMAETRGFIGLENNTGEDVLGPGSLPTTDGLGNPVDGIPSVDYRFLPATGGFDFVID